MTDRTTPQEASRAAFEAWDREKFDLPAAHYEALFNGSYPTLAVSGRWACWQAAAQARDAEVTALRDALTHIVNRLQMDIDDGGRPDQWSMEDLVRKARTAMKDPQQ